MSDPIAWQWEHKIHKITDQGRSLEVDLDLFTSHGWEIVSTSYVPEGHLTFARLFVIFRRRVVLINGEKVPLDLNTETHT